MHPAVTQAMPDKNVFLLLRLRKTEETQRTGGLLVASCETRPYLQVVELVMASGSEINTISLPRIRMVGAIFFSNKE